MPRPTILLLIGALAVLLSGSSCGNHPDDAPRPPPMEDGQMGYQRIPQQQIQPQVQSIPRR